MAALVVHVVPRARRTEVVGRHGGIVKIKVAATLAQVLLGGAAQGKQS